MSSTTDRTAGHLAGFADGRAVLQPGLRARRGRLAVFYLGCLLAAGAYGLTLLVPAFVKTAGGNEAQAGLIYWCGAFGAASALTLGGRLAERLGAGWAAAVGSAVYAVAGFILALSGTMSGSVYAAGVLLGAGWALFFTAAPIMVSSMAGSQRAGSHFLVLAGFNALGMGASPIAAQLLVSHGVSYRSVFMAAALLSLCSSALFWPLALRRRQRAASPPDTRPSGAAGPARLVLASEERPFLVMVLLGACVFTTMTAYQATFAAARGLSASIFYGCYTLGVIVPRFTVTGLLARFSQAPATTALLAGMCLSLGGFMLASHDPVLYAASSALLGVTYGLAYPLIQARAADSAPPGLRHWALWYFSLAYFAGIYGFPLIAGAVIMLGGYQALIACLLVIAALELAVSITAQHRAPGNRQPASQHEQNPDDHRGWRMRLAGRPSWTLRVNRWV